MDINKYNKLKRLNFSLEDFIEEIEKGNSLWSEFSEGIKKYDLPKNKEYDPISLNSFLVEHYFDFNKELRIIKKKERIRKIKSSGEIIDVVNSPLEWNLFNTYICDKYFPSFDSLLNDFNDKKAKAEHVKLFITNEINNLKSFYDISLPESIKYASLDIEIISKGEYNWQNRFAFGFQSVMKTIKDLKYDYSIHLPDLYFIHLGFIHGKYYSFLLKEIYDENLKESNVEVLKTMGEKLLFLKYTGVIDYLKSKLCTEKDLNNNLLSSLGYILGVESTSLKSAVQGLSKSNRNSPYTKKNKDKITYLLRTINLDKDADELENNFKKNSLNL